MRAYNAKNERIKKDYIRFLKEADRKADSTIDALASSLESSGAIDHGLAKEITKGVSDALAHSDEPDEVNGILHDLQSKISEAEGKGSATTDAATQLNAALDTLSALLHQGNGDENGNGNGNANGQD